MARRQNLLKARQVDTLGPGRHSDGDRLYLDVSETGARTWVFRFTWQGKPRETGCEAKTLAEARAKANFYRQQLKAGVNPIDAKREAKMQGQALTFRDAMEKVIAAKSPGWRGARHADEWRSTLENHASRLMKLPVDSIDVQHVLGVLAPAWQRSPDVGARVRERIEAILNWAGAHGHRDSERSNPARWRDHLEHVLPKRPANRKHHAALPYDDVPDFVAALRAEDSTVAAATEFVILTAVRSGEAIGATWAEINFDKALWTIPGERMKAGREHVVPLSPRALEILEYQRSVATGEWVFPGRWRGSLSEASLRRSLRRRGVAGTVHGFRSAFRDWAGDEANFPREVAEAALAHAVGDKAEQAYRRGSALEKRRELMNAWASYIDRASAPNNVVALPARA